MSFQFVDPNRLFQVLNNTGLQNKDTPLYQLLFNMIGALLKATQDIAAGSGGGGTSTVINNITNVQQFLDLSSGGSGGDGDGFFVPPGNPNAIDQDFVVLSDGVTPTPAPVDDGFGNFIYVSYTP